jgi:hypothetical protein
MPLIWDAEGKNDGGFDENLIHFKKENPEAIHRSFEVFRCVPLFEL